MFSSVGRLTYTIEETFTAKALSAELNRAQNLRLSEFCTDPLGLAYYRLAINYSVFAGPTFTRAPLARSA
jgi:hypothetical protein